MARTIAFALTAALLAPVLASAEERVYLLRTEENEAVKPFCPADDDIQLGAFVYAPRTRASDGLVMKDQGNGIGVAVGCGKFITSAPAPFAIVFDLGWGTVSASGYCTIANFSFPIPARPLFLVGCNLNVDPNPELGIVRGIATSASVFTKGALPGFQTGSFWTLHLYTAE